MSRVVICPQCGRIAEMADDQILGKQSIVCSFCGFHGYSNKSKLNVGGLPVIDIERFMVGHPRFSPFLKNYRSQYIR